MKSTLLYSFVLTLLLLPALSLYYKSTALDLPLLPPQKQDGWLVQFEVQPGRAETSRSVFPMPLESERQRISVLTAPSRPLELIESTTREKRDANHLVRWSPDNQTRLRWQYLANLEAKQLPPLNPRGSAGPIGAEQREFLRSRQLSPELEEQLSLIEDSLFRLQQDPLGKLYAIYYWITDEILINENNNRLDSTLLLESGSRLQRAELFNLMVRRMGIPARTAAAVRLSTQRGEGATRQSLTFFNEVFVNSEWYPIDVNADRFGHIPANYLVISRDWEALGDSLIQETQAFSIRAEPARTGRLDTVTYIDSLRQINPWLASLSFHGLPLSVQSIFYSILFIPFGAVLLAFSRNVLGVPSFGIFMPILLTLFFIETSLQFSLFFFVLIVGLGFIQRYILDRFYLLAIPRLSILLTLVIMTFGAVALFNYEYNLFPDAHFSLGYFPIVITTIFIERFSISFVEEGTLNTMKNLAGTFFIALLCYLLFQFRDLKLLVFTHPELLLAAIALCILIGSYKGYRVSEFFRFRDLARS